MNIAGKIREFIQENLVVWEDDISFSDTDNIFQLGFVNSLFAMKLLNFVEIEFDIKIENNEIELVNFSSVANMERLVKSKLMQAHE
ncbi:acyl carrier protein [Niastella sp. OAS944]|uniref:acyl carrier protein n=1 Tax=Niastella sp. OAS944 TaxID=2664089 RepID=UPI00347E3E60|nr:acyl carrier protein [Chitinophagaceae bacterium OAS944]